MVLYIKKKSLSFRVRNERGNLTMSKSYYVYILSNFSRTTLYTGVTDNLIKRVWQHKNEVVEGFTKKYKVHDLVYYESCESPLVAIEREKQIKSWSRKKKEELIKKFNPTIKDLYKEIL